MGCVHKSADKTLECPKCWAEMRKEEVEVLGRNITIDVCSKCQGMWLDDNELGKILGARKLASYLTKHIGTKSRSELVCPRFGGLMDLEYAGDVAVDTCLECSGAWLDHGELEKLKEKSAAGYVSDKGLKAEEEMEEIMVKRREKDLNSFFRRFAR